MCDLFASFDLSYDLYGYAFVIANDIFTALNGVYTKKRLESKDVGKYGLLYYNSLFMLPLMLIVILLSNDLEEVRFYIEDDGLTVPFITCFILSCLISFLLNYSLVLCVSQNTALTTCCIGPVKNIAVTYVGMVLSGDYIFNWINFLGLNISLIGTTLYTYVAFRTAPRVRHIEYRPVEKENVLPC